MGLFPFYGPRRSLMRYLSAVVVVAVLAIPLILLAQEGGVTGRGVGSPA